MKYPVKLSIYYYYYYLLINEFTVSQRSEMTCHFVGTWLEHVLNQDSLIPSMYYFHNLIIHCCYLTVVFTIYSIVGRKCRNG